MKSPVRFAKKQREWFKAGKWESRWSASGGYAPPIDLYGYRRARETLLPLIDAVTDDEWRIIPLSWSEYRNVDRYTTERYAREDFSQAQKVYPKIDVTKHELFVPTGVSGMHLAARTLAMSHIAFRSGPYRKSVDAAVLAALSDARVTMLAREAGVESLTENNLLPPAVIDLLAYVGTTPAVNVRFMLLALIAYHDTPTGDALVGALMGTPAYKPYTYDYGWGERAGYQPPKQQPVPSVNPAIGSQLAPLANLAERIVGLLVSPKDGRVTYDRTLVISLWLSRVLGLSPWTKSEREYPRPANAVDRHIPDAELGTLGLVSAVHAARAVASGNDTGHCAHLQNRAHRLHEIGVAFDAKDFSRIAQAFIADQAAEALGDAWKNKSGEAEKAEKELEEEGENGSGKTGFRNWATPQKGTERCKFPPGGIIKDASWGEMKVTEPPRTIAYEPKIRRKGRWRSELEGTRIRRLPRYLTDKRVFAKRRQQIRGTVIIDDSGSMSLTTEQIKEILLAAPAALVVAYSASQSLKGELRIIAKDFMRVKDADIHPAGGGNEIDLPALKWAANNGDPPYIWVSDGHIRFGGGYTEAGIRETVEYCLAHGIIRVPHPDDVPGKLSEYIIGGRVMADAPILPEHYLEMAYEKGARGLGKDLEEAA